MEKNMESNTSVRKKRMENMELLRILAMIMVIMLHYLSKGNVLPDMKGNLTLNGYLSWILEAFSIVAVNVYMLISGYFLVETGFKCRRIVQLIGQVLFYSIVMTLVLLATGVIQVENLTIYQLLQYILPIQMNQYWFATAYVMMYLFSPLLNVAVRNMKRNQLKAVIVLLLLFFSINKSILPIRLEIDHLGYDGIWFICVYLAAAYIRLYGIPFFKSFKKSLLCYLAGCGGIFGIALCIRVIYLKTGMLDDFMIATYHYNHILNLFTAISIFYAFSHCKIPEGKIADWIIKIGPYTFGVYLLHEQLEMRNLWPKWFGADLGETSILFLLRSFGSVLVVFVIGIAVDMLRKRLFDWIEASALGRKTQEKLALADEYIMGRKDI